MPVSVRLLGARPGPIQRDRHINPQPWDDAQVALRLICVSGLGGVAAEWDRVAPALARRAEVLVLELPAPAAGLDDGGGLVGAGQKMLRRVVYHDPSPVVLVGHSMGALVAMLTAAAESERVNGLVLTAPFLPLGRYGRSRLVTAGDYARHRVLFIAGAYQRRQPARAKGMSIRERAAGLQSLARFGLRPAAFHAEAALVRCPVLLVHGSSDHYVPPAFARAAAKRHPAWELRMIDGAGHFPHRDNPAAWLAAVEPWLASTPPSATAS